MEFEKILEEVGGFGLYQKLLCFLLIPFSAGLSGLVYYAQLIVLSLPDYQCLPSTTDEATYNKTTAAISTDSRSNDITDGNLTQSLLRSACQYPATGGGGEMVPCTDWVFDTSKLFPTISSENYWVCDEAWRPYTILTGFWVGNMVGAWVLGFLSDRKGRRPVILVSLLIYGVAGVASAFVRSFYGLLALRVMVGSVHHTLAHLPYVLVLEYCVSNRRVVPLLTIMMSYTLSTMLATVLGYLLWSSSTLVIVTAAPALAIVLVYHWIPESASWLLTQGKTDEAAAILHRIARVNNKKLSVEDIFKIIGNATSPNEESEAAVCIKDEVDLNANKSSPIMLTSVLNYPILRKRIIITMFVWMIGCMCYYGHTQNTSNLGDQLLLNYLLGAAVEIPAWSAPWLIEKIGRKPPLISAFLASGVVGIVYCAMAGIAYSSLVGLLGRLAVTIAYYISLQYGPEIFPTVVRGQGVALAETLGGVAIFLSPSVVYLEQYLRGLPLLVFGFLGCLAAVLTLMLPETKGVSLPHTLQQAEDGYNQQQQLQQTTRKS